MNDILIVGAGLAGSVCARLLAQKNYNVLVIDKNDFIGGNCYDYLSQNKSCYIHKFGPHIFHTQNKYIWDFINKFDYFNEYHHQSFSYINGQYFNFPINFNTFSQVYKKYIASKEDIQDIIKNDFIINPQTYQDMAINAVGKKMYEYFIKDYSEKQWKMKCSQIPMSVFKRINIRYNFNNDCFQNQFQGIPKHGYSVLISNILNHKNIHIQLNKSFNQIKNNNFKYIIYTGGFKDLPYRSLKFIHYTDKILNYPIVSYPKDKIITRITNFNILHKVTDSSIHYFCKEIPAQNNQFNQLYPIQIKNNIQLYNIQKTELLYKYNNILFCGRLALYKYLNMDKTIQSAINLINQFFNK